MHLVIIANTAVLLGGLLCARHKWTLATLSTTLGAAVIAYVALTQTTTTLATLMFLALAVLFVWVGILFNIPLYMKLTGRSTRNRPDER